MNILFDMCGYFLYPLCAVLGPVRQVTSFARISEPGHEVRRITSPMFGKIIQQEEYDIITAVLEFENGAYITVHLNSATCGVQQEMFQLYGDKGALYIGYPHEFDAPVTVQKTGTEPFNFPLIFGLQDYWFYGGLGIADVAWAITNDRPHRINEEFSLHLLELVCGIEESACTGQVYHMTTTMERPQPMVEGYVGNGFFTREEESALADMRSFGQ